MEKKLRKEKVITGIKGLFFISCFLMLAGLPTWVKADSTEEAATNVNAAGFTYSLDYPENQTDPSLGYFNLKVSPSQEQTISLMLSNPGTQAIEVDLGLNGAKTNKNGVVEYANDEIENDKSLAFPFETIVTGPKKVNLAAGETKQVDLVVKVPETTFEGIIAGGLQMMKAGQTDNAKNSGGSTVVNQYAYVVSIVLQEDPQELKPDLNYNKSYAGQMNYRNSIFINFSNIVPTFLNDLTVEAQISRKGNKKVLYEGKTTSMRMAPNSFIDYPVSMNGEKMVAGTYTAHVLATSGEQRWEWTEDFDITEEEAQKFNERDVGLEQDTGIDWRLILFIVFGFIFVVFLIFIILTIIRRKMKQENSKKSNRKNVSTTERKSKNRK